MSVSVEEFYMLLGQREVLIYEQSKQVRQLTDELTALAKERDAHTPRGAGAVGDGAGSPPDEPVSPNHGS